MDLNKKQEELPWWDKELPAPEEMPSQQELVEQIRRMKKATDTYPRFYTIRQLLTLVYLIANAFILYLAIGKPYQTVAFAYLAPGFLICLDYLNVARKLKDLKGGK